MNEQSIFSAADLTEEDVNRGMARLDPLTIRPRISTVVLCLILAVVFIASAFGIWYVGVYTETGQSYDDMVIANFRSSVTNPLFSVVMNFLIMPWVSVIISSVFLLVAIITVIVRKRWWIFLQGTVFVGLCVASSFLKSVLPRPFIINLEVNAGNSAPSGHMLYACAAIGVLLFAVSRPWRALVSLVGFVYYFLTACSVIYGKWHRPSDVIMAILLALGYALLCLAFTRYNGMDDPGQRLSSASVQIVSSITITAGFMSLLYGLYLVWQLVPGLVMQSQWVIPAAIGSTLFTIAGLSLVSCGLVLALRHISAAPLSKLGLVGAPPTPPVA